MIHALPGTGADHRMFPEPWGRLPGFKAHDWITSPGIRTVRQLAEAMVERCGIADGDVLVGVSLGGMVAGEITKLRKIPQLFLVSSAVTNAEMSLWFAKLHPLADKVPTAWLKRSAGKLPGDAAAMLADADPDFVRRMIKAIFQWEGLGKTRTQVFRIHGRKDRVIAVPKNCDLLLGGGHLIAMTHAVECARFVERQL